MDDNVIDYGQMGEDEVEAMCRIAFAKDFVFRSPRYRRGREEKELCDLLVLMEDVAILFQVKTPDMSVAHKWPIEKVNRWVNKKANEAISQTRGAINALAKKLVPCVHNERQGAIDLRSTTIKRFHAIAAVHAPPAMEFDVPRPRIETSNILCEVVLVNCHELGHMLHELSTIGDLVDFLEMRAAVVRRGDEWPGTELDMVAAYKTQYPLFKKAANGGYRITVDRDVWPKYCAMDVRRARDEGNAPSYVVDALIDELHKCRDYEPTHVPGEILKLPNITKRRYAVAAAELSRIRRIERKGIGSAILEKSRLCEQTKRPRFFSQMTDHGTFFLFLVSNEERSERLRMLHGLADLLAINMGAKRLVAVAINSIHHSTSSIDVRYSDLADGVMPVPTLEDKELFERLFQPPRSGKVTEYSSHSQSGSTKRFRVRERKSR